MSFRNTTLGIALFAIPPAIRGIMLTCLAAWLAFAASADAPFWDLLTLNVGDILDGKVWQLLTYQFLHDPRSPWHLVFNMLMLWWFGRDIERRWGGWTFLRYYLLCGVGAGLFHVLLTWLLVREPAPVVGASGAVLGVLVAFGMIFPRRVIRLWLPPVEIEARFFVLGAAVLEMLFAWIPSQGVANLAHLGGMLTGYLYLEYGGLLRLSRHAKTAGGWWTRWRQSRRRAHMRVVDREVERLLREDDEETRH
jgi:membrane associated rhomboid family serine protease